MAEPDFENDPVMQAALARIPDQNQGEFDPDTDPLLQAAMNKTRKDVTARERAMLGLIKEDPELQVRFLQRQGFEAKLSDKGEAVVRRGDQFESYNPEGIDVGDFLEYLPEAAEAVAGVAATGAKVMGALGAPATGGASVAAGAGLGGLITGAAEMAKQETAMQLGLRDEADLGRVGRQAALGATVPIPGLAGRAIANAVAAGVQQGLSKIIIKGTGGAGGQLAGKAAKKAGQTAKGLLSARSKARQATGFTAGSALLDVQDERKRKRGEE
jgi:hypothetical protein